MYNNNVRNGSLVVDGMWLQNSFAALVGRFYNQTTELEGCPKSQHVWEDQQQFHKSAAVEKHIDKIQESKFLAVNAMSVQMLAFCRKILLHNADTFHLLNNQQR